jgi:hypothetical protein
MAGGPSRFEIYGGLALREIGLYESSMADPLNHIGTTMKHFSAGGEIHYNSRFNPSAPTCDNSRIFTLEETVSKFELSGGE